MSASSAHLRLDVHGSRLRRIGRCELGHRVFMLDVQVGKLVSTFRMICRELRSGERFSIMSTRVCVLFESFSSTDVLEPRLFLFTGASFACIEFCSFLVFL